MPDTPSNDDQFADLFSKLPTPSARSGVHPESDQPAPAAAPLSRRAARLAATGTTPTVTDVPASDAPAPDAPASDAPAPDAPAPEEQTAPPAMSTPADEHEPAPTTDVPRSTTPIDALFAEEHPADKRLVEERHERDRRKGRIAGWVILLVVLAIIGGIVAGGLWVWNTYEEPIRDLFGWSEPKDYESGMAEGEALVTIVSGDTGATISERLYDAGVTKTSGAFYDYLISSGQNPTFVPGVFTLQKKMTSAAALEALLDPANKQENTAQLREGLTVEATLPLLADGIGLPIEDFQAAVADPSVYGVDADSLEGWLFPATYTFDPGVTAQQVIQTLVDKTVSVLDTVGVPAERRGEILTIASIIEREARFEDDFYKVSRVIQNRLDAGNEETFGKLQMDSTAQYGYGEMHDGTVSSSKEALEDDNPWNTYVHPGLPVGPIANPGQLAIDAAMNPVEGPWLYFVTVNLDTGETEFTETYAQHQQAIEKWTAWCEANPDSGC
ncbi:MULTISPECIES: endolytic transglycosylase MltG [Microbacterium]|uniref:Endolytic murein transglycosylase n=1 Tax=Microbacterium saccharophilum TaxID=1213358 RepID=A0A7Z7GCK5_9MICO|nr:MULTISPECIES: endolytic transglycosylase MltG [Microbacterium]SFI33516.1 UPF0755 protein [Microbacterium saccharophilum]